MNELIANYMRKQNLDKLFHVLGSLEICFLGFALQFPDERALPHMWVEETQLGESDRRPESAASSSGASRRIPEPPAFGYTFL